MEARKSPAGRAGQIISLGINKSKDRHLVLENIRRKVVLGENMTLAELRRKYAEDVLFDIGLRHVTTTKKAYCEAMGIPVEAGCRYKRRYEKEGRLVQSKVEVICPYTKHPAHLISTNPKEFEMLRGIKTNQISLFELKGGPNGKG